MSQMVTFVTFVMSHIDICEVTNLATCDVTNVAICHVTNVAICYVTNLANCDITSVIANTQMYDGGSLCDVPKGKGFEMVPWW